MDWKSTSMGNGDGRDFMKIAKRTYTQEQVDEFCKKAVDLATAVERERCAKIAENFKGGYTAAISGSSREEFVQDKDGPWVMNSDVAKAIRG